THTCTHTHIHIHMCAHAHTHVHTHTYARTHTHTHTHLCKHTLKPKFTLIRYSNSEAIKNPSGSWANIWTCKHSSRLDMQTLSDRRPLPVHVTEEIGRQ